VLAAAVVFFAHCRLWEVGLLEEWGFVDAWNRHGWAVLSSVELGRPLQNLVVDLGVSTGLGVAGVQIVLGLTTVGQFLVVLRFGGGSDTRRRWLALLVAFLVAMHPLWPAGFILRFLAAQFAILATLGALSLLLRYLRGGRAWVLIPSAVLTITALMTYQAPAVVLPLIALALGVMMPSVAMRRRVLAPVVTAAAVIASALWSTVVAAKLAPTGATYESTLLGNGGSVPGLQRITAILHTIAHIPLTLATRATATVVVMIVLIILLIVLRRPVGMPPRATWTLVVLTLLAPATSIPYAANAIQIGDPERVAGPAALTLGLVLVLWTVLSPPEAVPIQTGVVGGFVVGTVVATAISLTYYGRFAAIQRSMLDLIRPAVVEATGPQRVLIEDGSGVLGDVYTGYEADLSASSHVFNADPTNVVMCTIDGTVRHQPVAAVYPIPTTKDCSALPVPQGARLVTRGEIAGGPVKVYIIGPARGQGK
jgi:hypothetical protein